MIGKILSCRDESTLVIIVSDHGAKATTSRFDVTAILSEAGLLVAEEGIRSRKVDWPSTKAVPQRSCYIYVNLKGRDPDGIVKPGTEYEDVRERAIQALYNYTDKASGKKPILLALKREDARILGLYGERVGDIVYAVNPEFGGQHGPFLSTAKYGIGSLHGLFIMSGPGVKKGYVMQRTMDLTDIVPTICHMADLPVPKDTEGGILYQALEDPDAKLKASKKLKEDYDRLNRAYTKE